MGVVRPGSLTNAIRGDPFVLAPDFLANTVDDPVTGD